MNSHFHSDLFLLNCHGGYFHARCQSNTLALSLMSLALMSNSHSDRALQTFPKIRFMTSDYNMLIISHLNIYMDYGLFVVFQKKMCKKYHLSNTKYMLEVYLWPLKRKIL